MFLEANRDFRLNPLITSQRLRDLETKFFIQISVVTFDNDYDSDHVAIII